MRIRPSHIAEVLKREQELAPKLFNPTEEEKREAARLLGCEHHLPDPQLDLPMRVAA